MITTDIACDIVFEQRLKLPPNATYDNVRVKEIAVELDNLYLQIGKLHEELIVLSKDASSA